jgi:predicted O-linked N-acetylglucosamine transferase (SPINDLY family)
MSARLEANTPELQLLLACARVVATPEDETAIRQILGKGIDWTLFAGKAIDHGLAGLAGHTLIRLAPDTVPEDILDAFRANIDQTRRENRALFDELAGVIEELAKAGVEAIPFKGPVLAMQAYGDLGLRVFRDLDFIIRDPDLASAIAILCRLGYERKGQLTPAQFDEIHRLQGQEVMFQQGGGTCIEPHTRLTPIKMALDIDYSGLWGRAQRTDLNGRSMFTLAPEDGFAVLAIHGGKEMWWNIKWACDAAAFIHAHPKLDWTEILDRAPAHGSRRVVLLATSLARQFFHATIPDAVAAAERADPMIEMMRGRILARWHAGESLGPPSNRMLSMDRLRLHDGARRRARYVARTLFLPGPHHVAMIALPSGLSFGYVPIKLVHDLIALPLWKSYQHVLALVRRLQDALAGSDLASGIIPASRKMKAYHKARVAAERSVAADPGNAGSWRNLGHALFALKRFEEAIACYDKALAFEPDNPIMWKKRAAAMDAIGKKADLPDFALNAQDSNAWAVRAGRLMDSKNFAEAIEASDRALALDPENVAATRVGIRSRLFACDWHRREDDKRRISESVRAGQRVITPFFHRFICDSEAENLAVARLWAKGLLRPAEGFWRGERYHHKKIRIAYLSTDFRDHVVSDAIAGNLEHHDKTRFEITAISLGPNDGSDIRRRIQAAMDRFVDAQSMSDDEIATLLRTREIDIVIDLNGNSGEKRTAILFRRPTPLQVNFLGYPGTMGVPFIDYIIADRVVIPEEHQRHYSEKVAYLPHSFMPNDNTRRIADKTPSRIQAGLPERGFVFVCHNASHKISPEIFDIWMRLLRSVDGSVLWLKSLNPSAIRNLRHEAKARGVAPERLVFAPRTPRTEDHLARLRLADLFLDTLPYNAHATATDALWAGLPIVTCLGESFPGRVAASVLRSIGLPELVTASLAEYENLARMLAQDQGRLAAIKSKLMRNRETGALFDTVRFTRNLESAYIAMWERQQTGLPPASFAVASQDDLIPANG